MSLKNHNVSEHVMPVVTKMPLKRFAAAVERHTEEHGEPPILIWPTDTGDRTKERLR